MLMPAPLIGGIWHVQASYETGVAGLAWSVRRRQRGHETLTQFALSIRLLIAKNLRRLRRLDEAEYAFKVLAGECPSPVPLPPFSHSRWTVASIRIPIVA